MWHMAISDAVRQRVLDTLAAKDRDQAWMARVVGKSKGWATDFKTGRGTLSHAEMRRLAQALDVSEEFLWDGVTSTVTAPGKAADREARMELTGYEQMIIAIYRQLTLARQQTVLDVLTRLLREQTHVPPAGKEVKR